ncbi:TPA: hypothetical protein ACHTSK_004651 [Escherichia coli]|uniref:hypothetical protein n=1 Tax=Escherichia coli TaxID=562 RepID=UPI0019CF39B7|nr:hypothetical protein [Escherichia coli]MEB5674155.1 hypothetical protein [Escherichia coli]
MSKIVELPVERDEDGYWTHPIYAEFCGDREYITTDEFNAWLNANSIEWEIIYCDEDYIFDNDGDISAWQPEPPNGDSWFVGSIHDTEDGAVCVWLRNKEVEQ